jgi:beta-mannosidase
VTRLSSEHYEYLIKSAADAHFNMLRVWGGGIYEDDAFYELCDHYGICIWQDCMFACSGYAAHDDAFVANVKQEIAENVKRLRHHPCIALWCGNNELEHIHQMFLSDTPQPGFMTWDEYTYLFDDVIGRIVKEHDPERAYWPSSSHSPLGDRKDPNNPTCGDAHLWEVWHGRQPFEWYRTCEHRFNSEFGFQSFPEPPVVKSYTAPEDRNITSYIMEWHQRSQIGNDAIIQYMLSWYQLPTSFDMLLWLSQILQGMAMKYAVEHWRRSMPRGHGYLILAVERLLAGCQLVVH